MTFKAETDISIFESFIIFNKPLHEQGIFPDESFMRLRFSFRFRVIKKRHFSSFDEAIFPKVKIETIKTCSEFYFHGDFLLPRVFFFSSSSGLVLVEFLLNSGGEKFSCWQLPGNLADATAAYFYNLGNKQLPCPKIYEKSEHIFQITDE